MLFNSEIFIHDSKSLNRQKWTRLTMINYIIFALRRPYTILLALAVITLILVPGIARLEFDNSVESFMPKHDA